jgi:hypothetical protein
VAEGMGSDSGSQTIGRRTVGEWAFQAERAYPVPYADVHLDAVFTAPSGRQATVPAFYDGGSTWRVRFNPDEEGRWRYRTVTRLPDPGLEREGAFEVVPNASPGFVTVTPGEGWGFAREGGEPVMVFGDTVYHLFGFAHCGIDVEPFLRRRTEQGFNLLRVRLPVSPFHPPAGYSHWQTCRTWPWGGSEQAPRFDQINTDYFRTVDEVVRTADGLGLGLELIMEGWGFEFPFNSRQIFLPEWEELWMRYLIARYDAFPSTWFWTPLNEYEYYPNGDWNYRPEADRWQLRVSRWIKAHAPHGHPVAAHNGPRLPPFAERFASDPAAVDLILFQEWGDRSEEGGWLASGIEESIDAALAGWPGSAVLAEWGYERNPAFDLNLPHHEHCDRDHTRRGAWRGAFRALGIIHGFENSWGPWAKLDEDQPGMADLLLVRRFFHEIAPFAGLRPAPDAISGGEMGVGERPQALATPVRDLIAVYLPVGGEVVVNGGAATREARWFDPRTGDLQPAEGSTAGDGRRFAAPGGGGERPWDWMLVCGAAPG